MIKSKQTNKKKSGCVLQVCEMLFSFVLSVDMLYYRKYLMHNVLSRASIIHLINLLSHEISLESRCLQF